PFGYGDGGGGPTREMMERARRLADLDGSPRVAVEPPSRFFAAALAEYPDAPVWSGELSSRSPTRRSILWRSARRRRSRSNQGTYSR
ncbi:MAG: hypothetical protein ACLP3R_25250, partial [Candidatus Korobacteraceae bacterium]